MTLLLSQSRTTVLMDNVSYKHQQSARVTRPVVPTETNVAKIAIDNLFLQTGIAMKYSLEEMLDILRFKNQHICDDADITTIMDQVLTSLNLAWARPGSEAYQMVSWCSPGGFTDEFNSCVFSFWKEFVEDITLAGERAEQWASFSDAFLQIDLLAQQLAYYLDIVSPSAITDILSNPYLAYLYKSLCEVGREFPDIREQFFAFEDQHGSFALSEEIKEHADEILDACGPASRFASLETEDWNNKDRVNVFDWRGREFHLGNLHIAGIGERNDIDIDAHISERNDAAYIFKQISAFNKRGVEPSE